MDDSNADNYIVTDPLNKTLRKAYHATKEALQTNNMSVLHQVLRLVSSAIVMTDGDDSYSQEAQQLSQHPKQDTPAEQPVRKPKTKRPTTRSKYYDFNADFVSSELIDDDPQNKQKKRKRATLRKTNLKKKIKVEKKDPIPAPNKSPGYACPTCVEENVTFAADWRNKSLSLIKDYTKREEALEKVRQRLGDEAITEDTKITICNACGLRLQTHQRLELKNSSTQKPQENISHSNPEHTTSSL